MSACDQCGATLPEPDRYEQWLRDEIRRLREAADTLELALREHAERNPKP